MKPVDLPLIIVFSWVMRLILNNANVFVNFWYLMDLGLGPFFYLLENSFDCGNGD
jgi:hypothetical protein